MHSSCARDQHLKSVLKSSVCLIQALYVYIQSTKIHRDQRTQLAFITVALFIIQLIFLQNYFCALQYCMGPRAMQYPALIKFDAFKQ